MSAVRAWPPPRPDGGRRHRAQHSARLRVPAHQHAVRAPNRAVDAPGHLVARASEHMLPRGRNPVMSEQSRSTFNRRRFLGCLVAAPTLAVAVNWTVSSPAEAAVPTLPQPEQLFDLGDMQDLAAAPTSGLISVVVNTDGTAFFAVPRAEVGQGMTTAIAMMVSEELDLPLDKIEVGLADARPELLMNQLTGGSNSMRSMYVPVRTAAAIARQRLVDTAAAKWNADAAQLTTKDGVVTG